MAWWVILFVPAAGSPRSGDLRLGAVFRVITAANVIYTACTATSVTPDDPGRSGRGTGGVTTPTYDIAGPMFHIIIQS